MNGLDRWQQFNTFMDYVSPSLSGIARDVWLAMFRHADIGGRTWATRGRIASMLGVSTTHVDNGIRSLRKLNMIKKVENNNGYILMLPEITAQPELSNTQPELSPQDKKDTTIVITPDNHSYHPTQPELSPMITPVITPDNHSYHITEPSYRTSLHNPITEPIQKTKPVRVVFNDSYFNIFWKAYPRKVNKPGALKAWKNKKLNDSIDIILAGLERWKASRQWVKDGGQFVPHPATWINQERWNDDVETDSTNGGDFDVGF
jgi:hypothetical protein